MTRGEYIETKDGQEYEYSKRHHRINYIRITQEPKSKTGITRKEKIQFREEAKRQLKEMNRRAHTGEIILEIHFYVTKRNPPFIHHLTKNYLDLLHKTIEEDKLKNILFKDDNQIKILIANYHLEIESREPEIIVKSYPLGNFIKDIEFVDRIITNNFIDGSIFNANKILEEIEGDDSVSKFENLIENLNDFENDDKDWWISTFGKASFKLQEKHYKRQIQENYLRRNAIGVKDLCTIYQEKFSFNKIYAGDKRFQGIWKINENYLFFSIDAMQLGQAATSKGEKGKLKQILLEQLNKFKGKRKFLFPLFQPISLTIIFHPPTHNTVDVDNLAMYLVPTVIDILKPPATHYHSSDVKLLDEMEQENEHFRDWIKANKDLYKWMKDEPDKIKSFPKHSITSYQVIQLPRKKNSPKNGKIDIVLTDGYLHKSDVWSLVDEVIYKGL